MKTGDCGKCRVADECFPNQTECNVQSNKPYFIDGAFRRCICINYS